MKFKLGSKRSAALAVGLATALALSACGGGDSSKAATSGTSTSTSSAKSGNGTIDLNKIFDSIPGYQLTPLPGSVLSSARQQYTSEINSSDNSLAQQTVSDLNGRTVSKDSHTVAVTLGFAFNEQVASLPGFQDGFVGGIATDNPHDISVSGENAKSYTSTDGSPGIVFANNRVGLLVIGTSGSTESQLEDIMARLIKNIS